MIFEGGTYSPVLPRITGVAENLASASLFYLDQEVASGAGCFGTQICHWLCDVTGPRAPFKHKRALKSLRGSLSFESTLCLTGHAPM